MADIETDYPLLIQEGVKNKAALHSSDEPTPAQAIHELWSISDYINAHSGSLFDKLNRFLWHGKFVPKTNQVHYSNEQTNSQKG